LYVATGCRQSVGTPQSDRAATLRIGFGLASGQRPEVGLRRTARNIAIEGLVSIQRDGRPVARLAESWSVLDDGRALRIHLPPSLKFHSGRPLDAETLRSILQAKAPAAFGPILQDVAEIRAVSDRDVEFRLHQHSPFVLEHLDDDIAIADPQAPLAGTGPFSLSNESGQNQMQANAAYHAGKPVIDQISFKPYASLRSAWAELLRGQVDVLYDVGPDALESLESSTQVRIFPFQRGYAYVALFNFRRPFLRDPAFRRDLNAAIDRDAIVADVFKGHGAPAIGAISTKHWAYAPDLPHFSYAPRVTPSRAVRRIKCLFAEPSMERLALVVQRQLQAVGVDLDFELVAPDQALARLESGDFDMALVDAALGPNLARSYSFWHSSGPYNYGRYNSKLVDAALDSIRHAADDAAYKTGVTAFERAIVDDPPGIFLAWGERARAVSNRFEVPADPDAAIFRTLHLWRPAGNQLVRLEQP
jgi:peptide/nickel transport system substrate-binding protein